jgi:hypothetical protein
LDIFLIFFIIEFKNCGSKHDHGLLWIKNAPMYGVHTNEKIEQFTDIYISCDVSLLLNPLQNAQQHQYTCTCKKKNHVVCRFHYPLPPMHATKILEPFQINGNYPFSQQYLQTQAKKISIFKRFLKNDDISFFEYLNSLNLYEST